MTGVLRRLAQAPVVPVFAPLFALSCALISIGTTFAQDTLDPVSFHRDLRPLLQGACQGCHQPAKAEGSVDLTRYAVLLGEVSGAVLVKPGDPDASLLIEVVSPEGDLPPTMPQDGEPLGAAQVELLRRWIAEGAVDDSPASQAAGSAAPALYDRPPVVRALAFAPDGALLAVAGRGEVLLHAADGTGLVTRLAGLSERIESLAFSPDGARLAVAGGAPARLGELQVWNVASADLALSLPVTFDTIHGASWSSDGKLVAFGCNDTTVRAVEADTGAAVLFQGAHDDWVLGTTFSRDDSHVVTISRDRSMKLIKVASQQFIDNITSITPGALKGGLMAVDRRPDTDELLVAGADGTPKAYRTFREKKRVIGDDYNLLRSFEALPGRVFSLDWNADGSAFVAGSSLRGTGEVRVYRADDEAPLWTRAVPSPVYAVAFHPRAARVAAAGFDGVVRFFDSESGEPAGAFVPVPLAASAQEVTR